MSLASTTRVAMQVQALDTLAELWRFGHEVDLAVAFGRAVPQLPEPPTHIERMYARWASAERAQDPPRWRPAHRLPNCGGGGCALQKLSPDPGDDGVTDPEDEQAIAALNDALQPDPGEMPVRSEISAAHDAVYATEYDTTNATFEAPITSSACLAPFTDVCDGPPVNVVSDAGCNLDNLPVYAVDIEIVDLSRGIVPDACGPMDPLNCGASSILLTRIMIEQAWAVLYANRDRASSASIADRAAGWASAGSPLFRHRVGQRPCSSASAGRRLSQCREERGLLRRRWQAVQLRRRRDGR